MKFDNRYFIKFTFTPDQIKKNLKNAIKDLNIAKKVNILEVKFNYAYTALIKAGITLLSCYQVKVKSVRGHHVKIIEKLAQILKDENIESLGNSMRSKRNLDFYAGGIEVTEKECREYVDFVEEVLAKLKKLLFLRSLKT
jgi:histidyl-tRNA synthetase